MEEDLEKQIDTENDFYTPMFPDEKTIPCKNCVYSYGMPLLNNCIFYTEATGKPTEVYYESKQCSNFKAKATKEEEKEV